VNLKDLSDYHISICSNKTKPFIYLYYSDSYISDTNYGNPITEDEKQSFQNCVTKIYRGILKGIYFIRVASPGKFTDYKLIFNPEIIDIGDDDASAFYIDDPAYKFPLPIKMIPSAFETYNDQDWYKFIAETGEIVQIWTFQQRSEEGEIPFNVQIEILKGGDTPFAKEQLKKNITILTDLNGGIDIDSVKSSGSSISFVVPYKGNWYFRAKEKNGKKGQYTLGFYKVGYGVPHVEFP